MPSTTAQASSAAPAPTPVARARAGTLVGVVLLPAVATAAVVVALAVSGGAAADALLDPGAGVRWAAPVVAVLGDVAIAVTLGALLLAVAVLPRGTGRTTSDGRAWPRATLVAAGGAAAWTVLAVADVVLQYATIAGRPPSSPTFGAELSAFVTDISLGRTLAGVAVLAAVTCIAAMLATRPAGALVAALLALAALALLSQTGHAAGSTNHELAVASMYLHLVGAALWVGGLGALALLLRTLGRDLAVTVARFSTVAAWCLAAVALSGVLNAAVRVDSVDDLGTDYGVLLLTKVALVAVLGALGWLHRRSVVRGLAADDGARSGRAARLFWRLVLVELAVMGAVSGVAVALGRTPPPVPGEPAGPPTPAEVVTGHPLPPEPTVELWFTSFRWDPIPALGCLAAVVVYLRWVRRLRARGDAWPLGRTACALVGILLLAWSTNGGPSVYGHVLFSAHMLQHMVLVMVVPIFLALSAPVTLAARALPVRTDGSRGPREWLLGLVHSRWASFFAHPVVAAVNFAGSMVVFYFTGLFELSLTTYVGHVLMVAHFTVAGYLFVNALVGVDPGPTRPAYPLRLVLLFSTMAFHAFFGVALVSSETLLVADWFGLLGRPWGESALADQHTGGGIAWGISELPMLVLAVAVAVAWTREDERTARRRDRQADRDGDAELGEYNAMLERMAGGGRAAGVADGARGQGQVSNT